MIIHIKKYPHRIDRGWEYRAEAEPPHDGDIGYGRTPMEALGDWMITIEKLRYCIELADISIKVEE